MALETIQFQLTPGQSLALEALSGKTNVFLTGAAGTGKSELIKRFLKQNQRTNMFMQIFAVASTGAAAMVIKGSTFHSFFGLGICSGDLASIVKKAAQSWPVIGRLTRCSTLVIDEVSMLSGFALEAAEQIAREVMRSDLPWGGIRIIAVGDFAQLAPVSDKQTSTDWAFLHPVWDWTGFKTVYLTEVVRTSDADYIDILNHIRKGEINESVYAFLNARPRPSEDFDGTRLYPRRAEVDAFNNQKLLELPGTLHHVQTGFSGQSKYWQALAKSMQIPEMLYLKAGALVMLLRNDVENGRYFNGSLGTVLAIEEGFVEIKLLSGDTVGVEHADFHYYDERGVELATATNFPIKLAWASTIHKAQGISVDRISVSLSYLWEAGQAYVALSRARSLDGLFVEAWDTRSIKSDPCVMDFYNNLPSPAIPSLPDSGA